MYCIIPILYITCLVNKLSQYKKQTYQLSSYLSKLNNVSVKNFEIFVRHNLGLVDESSVRTVTIFKVNVTLTKCDGGVNPRKNFAIENRVRNAALGLGTIPAANLTLGQISYFSFSQVRLGLQDLICFKEVLYEILNSPFGAA